MLRGSEGLEQGGELVAVHAVREQVVGEGFREVCTGQLRLVAEAGVIHQAEVESQRQQ